MYNVNGNKEEICFAHYKIWVVAYFYVTMKVMKRPKYEGIVIYKLNGNNIK